MTNARKLRVLLIAHLETALLLRSLMCHMASYVIPELGTARKGLPQWLLERSAVVGGWEIVGTYEDHAISGAKGREQRPGLDSLLKDANRRMFDIVAAWSVDRIGRSLQDLLTFLGEIQALGIDLYLHQQGVDTSTPTGKAMFQMCGVFAEFERSIIRERVNAGLARAKANGKRLGRPSVGADVENAIRLALRKGDKGIRKIAREVGIGVSVVQRVRAAGFTH